MNPLLEFQLNQTRRQFFGNTGIRLGGLALASLGAGRLLGAAPSAVRISA